jgi:hypothetical protein
VRVLPIQIEHHWQDIAASTPPLPCADCLAEQPAPYFWWLRRRLRPAAAFAGLGHLLKTRGRGTEPEWTKTRRDPCRRSGFAKRISEATRLSDDPQCYWQPPRRRLPSPGVLVCRRHFRVFRQVADTSPPRAEGNHPNPCLPLRAKTSPGGRGRQKARGAASHFQLLRDLPQQDIVILFRCRTYPRKLPRSRRFRDGYRACSEAPPPRR